MVTVYGLNQLIKFNVLNNIIYSCWRFFNEGILKKVNQKSVSKLHFYISPNEIHRNVLSMNGKDCLDVDSSAPKFCSHSSSDL